MSNLTLRIVTALVGVPILLGAAYVGGWVFALVILGLALLGQYELYRMLEKGGLQPFTVVGLLLGGLLGLRILWPEAVPAAVLIGLVLLASVPFLSSPTPLQRLSATVFGVVYPTLLLMTVVEIRLIENVGGVELQAFYLVLALFLLVWVTDSMAYFTGRALGKRPLAPSISPNKTVEGAFGGLVGALVVAFILGLTLLDFIPWLHIIVLAVATSVLSQLGDLTESAIKRSVEVKDSGTLIPGHGGVLDRFDAVILAAPMFFIYVRYVANLVA